MITDTLTMTYYLFTDGTYGIVHHSMSFGEAVIILLLTAIVFLQVVNLWMQRRYTR